MIRTLLIASLATLAAAEAEPKADADPYLIYGGYPYTHGLTYGAGYHPYYTYPIVKKAEEAEVKEADSEEKKTVIPLHYPINYGYYGHPLTPRPRLTHGLHTVAMPVTHMSMVPALPITPTLWSPRRTLRLSPLLMLRPRLIPGWPTDTTDTDSGHTDTAPTTADTPTATDMVATDIPSTDKHVAYS